MTSKVYQIRISTKYIKPSIWRVILVPADATFMDLHEIIMAVFGFNNSHLFAFNESNEYGNQIGNDPNNVKRANRIKLSQQFNNIDKMNYTYDFGDDWEFIITLQKTLSRDKDLTYPQCIKWKGGMMLEDCGGYYGYEVITNWCRNKTEETAQELIEYYGDKEVLEWYTNFNPDEFNPTTIVLNEL